MKTSVLVGWIHGISAVVYLLMATSVIFTAPRAHWPIFVSWPSASSGNVFFSTQEEVGSWNLAGGATVLATIAALYQGLRTRGSSSSANEESIKGTASSYWVCSWLIHSVMQIQIILMGGCGDLMVWVAQGGLVGAEHVARYWADHDNLGSDRRRWWQWTLVALGWRWMTTWPYYVRAWVLYAPELPEYAWTAWTLGLVWDLSLALVTWSGFTKTRWRRSPGQQLWLYEAHLSLLVQSHALSTVLGAWARA